MKKFSFKVFHRIKDRPELFKKITPVYGDITSVRLGLSDEEYERVVATTNIVYHMAASLKLEATLKPNVEMNLTGTKHVLEMCKEMKNLLTVLHLSTAFCNCDQEIGEEVVYDWSQKPMDLIKCAKWMSEEAMAEMGKSMMKPHPNTYTFTKRMAEILVRDEYNDSDLNVCIVRPSIVTPAWKGENSKILLKNFIYFHAFYRTTSRMGGLSQWSNWHYGKFFIFLIF